MLFSPPLMKVQRSSVLIAVMQSTCAMEYRLLFTWNYAIACRLQFMHILSSLNRSRALSVPSAHSKLLGACFIISAHFLPVITY